MHSPESGQGYYIFPAFCTLCSLWLFTLSLSIRKCCMNARVIETASCWLIITSLAEILALEPLNTSACHTGVNLVCISSLVALIHICFKYLHIYISKSIVFSYSGTQKESNMWGRSTFAPLQVSKSAQYLLGRVWENNGRGRPLPIRDTRTPTLWWAFEYKWHSFWIDFWMVPKACTIYWQIL